MTDPIYRDPTAAAISDIHALRDAATERYQDARDAKRWDDAQMELGRLSGLEQALTAITSNQIRMTEEHRNDSTSV